MAGDCRGHVALPSLGWDVSPPHCLQHSVCLPDAFLSTCLLQSLLRLLLAILRGPLSTDELESEAAAAEGGSSMEGVQQQQQAEGPVIDLGEFGRW